MTTLFLFLYVFWVSFFLILWFFKYVTRSIILIRFCTGAYNNSFQLCFNLWLHITASLSLICRSHGSQRAFQLRHEPYSKINLDCKIFCAAPTSHSFCPTSSMSCLWANLGNVHVDISGNNPTTKNVGCKICIVVEITLESKWMISRKAFSTNRSWKKMCMRFLACPSQCQDLTLKEVNKLWESYDPERIVASGPRFLTLNETNLKVTQCNIKDCTRWSTHWIIHVNVVLVGRWYILESHSPCSLCAQFTRSFV